MLRVNSLGGYFFAMPVLRVGKFSCELQKITRETTTRYGKQRLLTGETRRMNKESVSHELISTGLDSRNLPSSVVIIGNCRLRFLFCTE